MTASERWAQLAQIALFLVAAGGCLALHEPQLCQLLVGAAIGQAMPAPSFFRRGGETPPEVK